MPKGFLETAKTNYLKNMAIKISWITLSGMNKDATIVGDQAVIGRNCDKCDVYIADQSLSRQHCRIELIKGDFFITDLGSVNGVHIDGKLISPNIKTHFATFNQLQLGTVECHVEETEQVKDNLHETIKQSPEKNEVTKTIKVSKQDLQKLKSNRVSKGPLKNNFSFKPGLVLPFIILAAGIAIFNHQRPQLIKKANANTFTKSAASEKIPIKKAETTQDTFKLNGFYIENKSKVSCQGFEAYCQSLQLDQSRNEGFIKDDQDLFVYMNMNHALELESYSLIKQDKWALDLIAFNQILTSPLLDDYLLEKYLQLHILLLDQTGKIIRIYRLHPVRFKPASVPRMELIAKLTEVIKGKDSETFMTEMNKFTVKKEFSED